MKQDVQPSWPQTARLITLALALFFAGDRALAWGLGQLQAQSGFRIAKLYAGRAPADVLVLGNSRGVNAFLAPALGKRLGQRVVNLSYNGMAPPVAEALLLDHLERHEPPRLVLVEGTLVLSGDGLARALSGYFGESPRLQTLGRAAGASAATELVHLYRFNNELFHRALFYWGRSDQSWTNTGRASAALVARTAARPPETELPEIRPENLAALGRIVQAAKARGATVKVVLSPYLPARRDKLEWWPQLVAQVEAAADAPVLDYSRAIEPTDHFADGLHLNQKGARALAERLLADGVL